MTIMQFWSWNAPRALALALVVLLVPPAGCGGDAAERGSAGAAEAPPQAGARAATYAGPVLDLPPEEPEAEGAEPQHETERDWAIARGTLEWAVAQGLGGLPTGEVAALIGSTFVGTPYEPGSLEIPGPERLVVNLRTFDCVTLVEHVLVLARLTRAAAAAADPEAGPLGSEDAFRRAYREELTGLRYRGGAIDGYLSRLHYFTEWLDHAIGEGILDEATGEVGGVADERPIHFMSSNPEAYRQLAEDPALVEGVREIEARLSAGERLFVPQERIAEIEGALQNGDVVAAVSNLDGLDIAHTGFVIRHAGRVHLLHAPLVGDSVEVSAEPLADRIQRISGQKGIRVARPR